MLFDLDEKYTILELKLGKTKRGTYSTSKSNNGQKAFEDKLASLYGKRALKDEDINLFRCPIGCCSITRVLAVDYTGANNCIYVVFLKEEKIKNDYMWGKNIRILNSGILFLNDMLICRTNGGYPRKMPVGLLENMAKTSKPI